MKKYFKFAMMALTLGFGFAACDVETNEEPGGTNVQNLAGRWVVTIDALDTDGTVLATNILDEEIELFTYNTADNDADKIWITAGHDYFWEFMMKIPADASNLTFSCPEMDYDEAGTGKAIITNGKVLLGKATNLHGMPNDSIVFDISFNDDDPAYGYIYRISGQKYTGFYE